jgi:hypothetical protein
MAGWCSNLFLLIGSMKVDIAFMGVAVFWIKSIQPENTTQNEILIPSLLRKNSGAAPAFEDHPGGLSNSDFLGNPKPTRRGSKTPFFTSQTKSGR